MNEIDSKSLPENAYQPLKPGERSLPIVPAESTEAELTLRSVFWGIVFCIVFSVASAYSVRPVPDARVSAPVTWDELPECELGDFTIATVPGRFAAIGDPASGIDEAVGSLEGLLELSARQAKAGLGDAPWPPNYAKAPGEPPRVAPSRARTSVPSSFNIHTSPSWSAPIRAPWRLS